MALKSCGFAIGNLRARETALLRDSDMAQLCSLKSADALATTLRDKGFGDRTAAADVPELLHTSSVQLWRYLEEISPDSRIFEPFLAQNDFHNLKAILKALIRNTDAAPYLLTPALTDPAVTENAVKEKRFDLLPEYLQAAAERAYEILTGNGDAQFSDAVIDAARMRTQSAWATAKDYHCPLAREILQLTVFFDNVKAALRCAKAQKSAAFLEETLTDTAFVSKNALKKAALVGEESLLNLLKNCGAVGIRTAEAFERSPADFERFCDDTVMQTARKAKRVTLGTEPIVGYYIARLAEMKNVRIIYSGIKTNAAEEAVRGRLRELYD